MSLNPDDNFMGEYPLEDIFEPLSDEEVKEDIKITLKREGKWHEGDKIVIPPVSQARVKREYKDSSDFYNYAFNVYDASGNNVRYKGMAYGDFKSEIGDQMLDMRVELYRGHDYEKTNKVS